MADRTVKVTLIAQVSNYVAAMHKVQEETNKAGKGSEKFNEMQASLNTAAKGAVAFGGAITAVGVAAMKTGIQYNTLQQTTRAALTTLLGSAKAANEQMDKLDTFARTSPFAKQVFISAQQQMLGFGVEAKKVIPALDAIQNAVAAMGGSNDQIAAIADIMSRMNSEARLSGDALQRLGYYGIDAASLIADSMGTTAAEIRDMARKPGGIPIEQVWDPLVNAMQEKFGGAADNVKQTFAGSMDRMKAAWRDFSSDLAEPLVGKNGGGALVDLFNWTADMMRSFIALPAPIKTTAAAAIGLVGAISLVGGTAVLAMPKIVAYRVAVETLKTQSPLAAKALGGLSTALKAVGSAIAIGAVVAAFDSFEKGIRERLLPSAEELTNALTTASTAKDLFDKTITHEENFKLEPIIKSTADFHDALKMANDEGNNLLTWLNANTSFTGAGAKFTEFRDEWRKLGDALAETPDRIAPTFEMLRDGFGATDQELTRLIELSPALKAALTGIASSDEFSIAATDANLLGIALGDIKPKADASGAAMDDAAESATGYSAALGGAAVSTEDAVKAQQKWIDAVSDADASFIDLQGAYQSVIDKNKDIAESTAKATKSSKDSWEDYYDGVTVKFSDFLKQLEDQVKAQQDWEKNMIILAGKVSEGTLSELAKMGPQAAPLVADMVKASGKELSKMDSLFKEKSSDATYAFASALDEAKPIIEAAATQLGKSGADKVIAELAKGSLSVEEVIKKYNLKLEQQPLYLWADTHRAVGQVDEFVKNMGKKSITIRVYADGVSTMTLPNGREMTSRASGGILPGAPSSKDNMLIHAASGEYVVNAAQTARNRKVLDYINAGGVVPGYATGGIVGAREKLNDALAKQRAAQAAYAQAVAVEKSSGSSDAKSKASAAKSKLSSADSAVKSAMSALASARNTLVTEKTDWSTLLRRREAGSESPMSLVDRLLGIATDTGGKPGSALRATALKSEKAFLSLTKQADAANTKLSKVTDTFNDLKDKASQMASSVASAVRGFFNVGDLGQGTTRTVTGDTQVVNGITIQTQYQEAVAASAGSIASQMAGTAARIKTFAAKLTRLSKTGLSPALLAEIASLGVENGEPIVDALLTATKAEISSINASYKTIGSASTAAGNTVADANYKALIDQTEKQLQQAQKNSDAIEKQLKAQTDRIIKSITSALSTGVKRAGGGILPGYPSSSDNMILRAASGEFVVNAGATMRNRALLEHINGGGNTLTAEYARPVYVTPSVSSQTTTTGVTHQWQVTMPITANPQESPEVQAMRAADQMWAVATRKGVLR